MLIHFPMTIENRKPRHSLVVQDGGKTIKVIGVREDSNAGRDLSESHSTAANDWLNENYPDWQDRTAYWD